VFDLMITGGIVIDGSGRPAFPADIGVSGDRIVAIGDLTGREAGQTLTAAGCYVTPGFIDMHTHSDETVFLTPLMESKIHQGVTCEVTGNCGASAAPLLGEAVADMERELKRYDDNIPFHWRSVDEYLDQVSRAGLSTNYLTLVGQGVLRAGVMGHAMRPPTTGEMTQMQNLLRQSLEEGAYGLSTGLIYPPSSYADVDELAELSRVMSPYGGFYASHIRNEGDRLLEAVTEAITIGERAGVPVHLAHHKAAGKRNWGKVEQSLALIEAARHRGVAVTADQYPYIASSTGLGVILPDWAHEGGTEAMLARLRDPEASARIRAEVEVQRPGWENVVVDSGWHNIVIAGCRSDHSVEGLNTWQIAEQWGMDPIAASFKLLLDNDGSVSVVIFSMCEEDVQTVMRRPYVCVGSDSTVRAPTGPMSEGKPHPRAYGTFPRVLGRYVRELGVLTWEEAVRKMTSLSADRLGLKGRGRIAIGSYADLVIFDPATVADRATFTDPHQFPAGIETVIVNGVVTIQDGRHSGAKAGRVLRRGRD